MAAEIPSGKKRKPPGFMSLLSSAACEWFLIFLLFLDAALSYLLTKFAHYCELQTPCLLCSRLDYGFRKKKPGFYWSLLCTDHTEEISSLVSCSIHSKFADIHGMCDECLMPIVMHKKSNSDTHRLLIGKSWVDVDHSVIQSLLQNKNIKLGSPDRRTCSCCNKIWRAKSCAQKLLEPDLVGLGASKANVKPPLPRVPGRTRFGRRDSLKRLRDKLTGPTQVPSGSNSSDMLSHVGYTKLKISSDSETEVPFSEDDDDGRSCSHEKNNTVSEHERIVQCDTRGQNKIQPGFEVKPQILDQLNLLDLSEQTNFSSFPSEAFVEHSFRDHDWDKTFKHSLSSTMELISVDDGPGPRDIALPEMSALLVLSELLSLYNVPPLSNTVTIAKKINVEGTTDKVSISVAKNTEAASGESCVMIQPGTQKSCDMFRLLDSKSTSQAVSTQTEKSSNNTNGSDVSTQIDETSSETSQDYVSTQTDKTSDKTSQDYVSTQTDKTSDKTSQDYVSTQTDEISSDTSRSDVSTQTDEISNDTSRSDVSTQTDETSSNASQSDVSTLTDETANNVSQTDVPTQTGETRNLPSDHASEPIDASHSAKTEEDIESPPQEVYPSEMGLLPKDTSPRARDKTDECSKEEDSSSQVLPVSAPVEKNESLETVSDIEGESITDRLKRQIEHDRNCMSSLYKELEEERNAAAIAANQAMAMITRLQEEKAALHMEALQYLRMMEEQAEYDMEALERANELLTDREKELQDLEAELEYYRNNFVEKSEDVQRETSVVDNHVAASNTSLSPKSLEVDSNCEFKNGSVSNFEDEKLYIMQRLMKLENKLHKVHFNGELDGNAYLKDLSSNGKILLYGNHAHGEENGFVYEKHDKLYENGGEPNLNTIEKEIVELHERLEAIEADRDFLKHASDLVRNGKDGLQLIQDIAHQLQELRKIEYKTR